MAWEKSSDGLVIAFDCDTCDVSIECDVKTVRAGGHTVTDDKSSDFAVCLNHVKGIGWKSFKRTGHPWTYHCPACVPAAEDAHTQHRSAEAERDRIKARNAR
jgi:hypothetical protein